LQEDTFRTSGIFKTLIAQKRTEIIATRHDFWVQNFPKCCCRRGPHPAGGAHGAPEAPSLIWGSLCGKEERGVEREEERGGEGDGEKEGEKRGGRRASMLLEGICAAGFSRSWSKNIIVECTMTALWVLE